MFFPDDYSFLVTGEKFLILFLSILRYRDNYRITDICNTG